MSTEKVNTVVEASVSAYLQMRESVDTKLFKAEAEKAFLEQFSQKLVHRPRRLSGKHEDKHST